MTVQLEKLQKQFEVNISQWRYNQFGIAQVHQALSSFGDVKWADQSVQHLWQTISVTIYHAADAHCSQLLGSLHDQAIGVAAISESLISIGQLMNN